MCRETGSFDDKMLFETVESRIFEEFSTLLLTTERGTCFCGIWNVRISASGDWNTQSVCTRKKTSSRSQRYICGILLVVLRRGKALLVF